MNPFDWFRERSLPVRAVLVIGLIAGILLTAWLVAPLFIVVSGNEGAPTGFEPIREGMFVGV